MLIRIGTNISSQSYNIEGKTQFDFLIGSGVAFPLSLEVSFLCFKKHSGDNEVLMSLKLFVY